MSDTQAMLAAEVTSMMTRDDFEEWLTDHGEEAIDRINQTPRGLRGWVASYLRALGEVAENEGDSDTLEATFTDSEEYEEGSLFSEPESDY